MFKISLWIAFFCNVNIQAMVVENLLTGEIISNNSNNDNHFIYKYNKGDRLDIACRKEKSSEDKLGWIINNESEDKYICNHSSTDAIRFRLTLASDDNNSQLDCSAVSSEGVEDNFVIQLMLNDSDEDYLPCLDISQLVCPETLNEVYIEMYVNGNLLKPDQNHFLPAYEFTYHYKQNEVIEVACSSKDSPLTIFMCADTFSNQETMDCDSSKESCIIKRKIDFNFDGNNHTVNCFTTIGFSATTQLKLIPARYVNDTESSTTVPPEMTTENSENVESSMATTEADRDDNSSIKPTVTVTVKPLTDIERKLKENEDTVIKILQDTNRPVFIVSPEGFYTAATIAFSLIFVCIGQLLLLIYRHLKSEANHMGSSDIPLEQLADESTKTESPTRNTDRNLTALAKWND